VRSGSGGSGCVSFRREKYVPHGGPDGGDGGCGGDIIFIADSSINTLMSFRYKKNFFAQNGRPGSKKNCHGKDGKDLLIKVPVGTIISDFNSQNIICDLSNDFQKKIILNGGKGGRGNQHFANSRRQAPKYFEPGEDYTELDLILELKLIADVGLVGMPNVGKSSLLAVMTNANPKIADYKFTTLSPNLGVASVYDKNFVIADIPGLIEGASNGLGLGYNFLRHIERTRILVHVVDISDNFIIENILKINYELDNYNHNLLKRKNIICANKLDLYGNKKNIIKLKRFCEDKNLNLFFVSAVKNLGLDKLILYLSKILFGNN
jgi:GTP-binding protein